MTCGTDAVILSMLLFLLLKGNTDKMILSLK